MKWAMALVCPLLLATVLCAAREQSSESENPKWRYDRIPDKMTGKDTLAASIESADGMYLAIERHPDGVTTAYVFFLDETENLFFCGLRGCTVRLRFDGGKIEPWSAVESSYGSNKDLSFIQVADLISRLKHTHRVIVEVPIFERGPTAFEFFVGGLIWPPPPEQKAIEALNGAEEKSKITPPSCFLTPQPPYSEDARIANFHGHVIVQGTVTLEGKVENIRIEKSPGLGLDQSIVNTLKEWKCKPASGSNGQPISFTLPFDINFQIESGAPLGLTLAALQKLYPWARCYYADEKKPETVEFCIIEPAQGAKLLLFGKLSVTREVVSFGAGIAKEINATLNEKIMNVRTYLEEVIPTTSDQMPSLWKYKGETISITYGDENTTEMRISGY